MYTVSKNMRERFNTYTLTRPRLRKIIGWVFVIVGFVALILPLIPGAPLVFIGLEILGLRFLLTDKIKSFLPRKQKSDDTFDQSVLTESTK